MRKPHAPRTDGAPMPATMHAVRVHDPGGPDALRYEETERPEPGPGEVRVAVEAAGLNFIDTYHRSGAYPLDPPFTPGTEAAGTVAKVGDGVKGVDEGDRVGWTMHTGTYAEQSVVPAAKLVPLPDAVDTHTAAAVLLQGMTAHYLSHDTFILKEGDTCLVHAAAGGVGQLLTQMAKVHGATVFGTVSTDEKARIARDRGVDHAIKYTEEDFEAVVRDKTEGTGVHVVYDGVGKSTFDKSLACLRRRGMLVLYGQASGPVAPLDPQRLNKGGSLYLTRPSLAHYVAERQELLDRARQLFRLVETGRLRVTVDRTFKLEEASEAHRYIEGRNTMGKVLLIP